jgi:superfamily II DNA/RNA helicase
MPTEKYELSHGIKHFYIAVEKEEWKLDTLRDLYDTCLNDKLVVIYCNPGRKLEWLTEKLEEHQCRVGAFVLDLNANVIVRLTSSICRPVRTIFRLTSHVNNATFCCCACVCLCVRSLCKQ